MMLRKAGRRALFSQAHRIVSADSDKGELFYLHSSKGDKAESFWSTFQPTKNHFKTVNAIVEIPYGTFAKFELKKELKDHPHGQDQRLISGTKQPRFYQVAPLFNYGYIPQTWDANRLGRFKQEGLKGDMDPIDIVELSDKPVLTRLPVECVVIGALGLIDQGEVDWKILMLQTEEAKRLNIETLAQAEAAIPFRLDYMREFFRVYKTHEGKKENTFLREGRFFNEEEAREIVSDSHKEFGELMKSDELREVARRYNLR